MGRTVINMKRKGIPDWGGGDGLSKGVEVGGGGGMDRGKCSQRKADPLLHTPLTPHPASANRKWRRIRPALNKEVRIKSLHLFPKV